MIGIFSPPRDQRKSSAEEYTHYIFNLLEYAVQNHSDFVHRGNQQQMLEDKDMDDT